MPSDGPKSSKEAPAEATVEPEMSEAKKKKLQRMLKAILLVLRPPNFQKNALRSAGAKRS